MNTFVEERPGESAKLRGSWTRFKKSFRSAIRFKMTVKVMQVVQSKTY